MTLRSGGLGPLRLLMPVDARLLVMGQYMQRSSWAADYQNRVLTLGGAGPRALVFTNSVIRIDIYD